MFGVPLLAFSMQIHTPSITKNGTNLMEMKRDQATQWRLPLIKLAPSDQFLGTMFGIDNPSQ